MASEDEELSRDVNTLGRLLGEVLREQEGEAIFAYPCSADGDDLHRERHHRSRRAGTGP